MPDERGIILVTATPKPANAGDFLQCDFTSDTRTCKYGLRWHDAERFHREIGKLIKEHRARNNVARIKEKVGH